MILLCACALSPTGCNRRESKPEVVLYTSCDDYLLRDVIPQFEKDSGITVKIVGDTEATKTTGLVERLLSEKERPRADVWWSNEPFGTVRLDQAGLLEPNVPQAGGPWPRAKDDTWRGFALRARAIGYNSKRLGPAEAPATAADFADPRWKGRIGMARPHFGTTRGQLGALLVEMGEDRFRAWVTGLKNNSVRLYDGNLAVVRAVANGEIDAGLTDTDDVFAGQREGWPVALVPPAATPLLLPNTIARVRGGPHPAQAAALIEFILSPRVELILAHSDSHTTPVGAPMPAELASYAVPTSPLPDFERIAGEIPRAIKIWDEVFGGP